MDKTNIALDQTLASGESVCPVTVGTGNNPAPVKLGFNGDQVQLLDAISLSRRAAEASGTTEIELSFDGIPLRFTTETAIKEISRKYFGSLRGSPQG